MKGGHVVGRRWAGVFAGLGVTLLAASSQALDFNNSESAGNASIDNENDTLTFNDQSDAGTATVDNNTGSVIFNDQSTAASASIVNIDDATTEFYDQTSAGSASLVNELDGHTEFYGSSSASNATILTKDGGSTVFNGNSTAGNARLIANDSGFVDFSASTGLAADFHLSAGSIEGSGNFQLGSVLLSVGSNNLSGEMSGFLTGGAQASLIKVGSGTLTLSGNSGTSFGGSIRIEGGLINFNSSNSLGSGAVILDGGGLQWATGTTTDISSRLSPLGNAGGVFDTNGNDVTLATALSGSGALSKTGNGLLLLNALNSYSGGTVVQAGTLRQGVAGAFVGNTAYTINGGTLELNGFDLSISSLAGSGGVLALGSAQLTINQAGNSNYAGSINGTGGLTKLGVGTLQLDGVNSYSGGTLLQAGSLRQGLAGGLVGNSAYTLDGGTLDLNGFDLSMSSLAGSGGALALGSAQLTVNQASNSSYAGSIGGTGSLTKLGAGIVQLDGLNSYSGGTLLQAGILRQGVAGGLVGGSAYTVDGGSLDLNNFDLSMSSLAGSGGALALGSAQLTVNQTGNSSYAGSIGGSGGLTKLGAGLLLLDGANSYSGGTTVQAGTLRQGATGGLVGNSAYTVDGGTLDLNGFDLSMISLTGSGGAVALGNAQLTINQAGNTSYAGSIGGTGGLTKLGGGTLQLDGVNSYSGGTLLQAGSLRQGLAGGLVGNSAYTLDGGTLDLNGFDLSMSSLSGSGGALALGSAQLTVNQTGNTNYAGSIAGTGGLTKLGAGLLLLDGTNSYSGGTLMQAGTLRQGVAGGLVGNSAYTLDGGTLDLNSFDLSMSSLAGSGGALALGSAQLTVNQASNSSYAGSIGGTGGLTKLGGGTLQLDGVNSYSGGTLLQAGTLRQGVAGGLVGNSAYTVDGGTLDLNSFDLTMSSLAGSGGALALGSAQLTLNQAGNSSYASSIGGSGGLTKLGAGTLTLSGNSSYAGATQVDAGTLLVNGSLLSAVTVGNGAILGGNGSVGATQVDAGGMLAPGNSIGTLLINGDLNFASASFYQVEVDPAGNTDLLVVSGQASLAGTVQVLAGPGEYALGTVYSILQSANPLLGQFDAVTSNLAFLDPSLTYSSDEVFLTLLRNDISFQSLAQTPNQRAFASGADSLPASNEVLRTLINLSTPKVPDAFNRFSGDAHASFSTALLLDDLGVPWVPLDNLNANLASPERVLPFWLQLQSGHQRTRDDGNAGLVVVDNDGLLMGSDWPIFGGWRMGVAMGYGDQQLGVSSRGANADAGTYRSAVYLGNQLPLALGTLKFSAGVTYSRHQIDGQRSLRLVDGPERLTSRYDMGITQGFSELSLRMGDEQQHFVEPFARLVSVDQRVEGFDERGGSAALNAASQASQVLSSTLGTRGQYKTQLLGRELVLKGSLAMRQLQGDLRPELELRLNEGEPFKVLGTRLPKNSVLLDLHADYAIAPGIGLDIRYKGMSGSGSEGNALAASLRWRF